VGRLASRGAYLAPGIHIFYELAKTFRNPDRQAQDRGKKLFSYFKRFIEANTHCVKDNMELLAREMWALKLRTPVTETLLSKEDRVLVFEESDKLANGELSERGGKFLEEQGEFASTTRSNQVQHLKRRADMKRYLKSISPNELEKWLQRETTSPAGITILTHHIQGRFPEIPVEQAAEYASALLAPPAKRFARGVIRSDLYYNWRCAYRDSVPKDLIDDMYHVLNSIYCDVYATGEKRQAEYAHLLLTSNTEVAIYTDAIPVVQWIEGLVSRRPGTREA
jgi:hypothetical protein